MFFFVATVSLASVSLVPVSLVPVSLAPTLCIRVLRDAVGHNSVHVGAGSLTGIAVSVKAAANLGVVNSWRNLGVKVGALATEARVAAGGRLLKPAGDLSSVALHMLIDAVGAVAAATRTIEEAALLGLTVFIQLHLLVAHAGLFTAHGHCVNHLMSACAFLGSPVEH